MKYYLLANATALTHTAIVLAVLIGILVSVRYKRFRPWESLALIIVVLLWSYYGSCPFTILEQHFRTLAGQLTDLRAVGFIPYYAHKFFNISLESQTVVRSTYFMGGIFFLTSIEWMSPYVNLNLFSLRKTLRKLSGKKHRARK